MAAAYTLEDGLAMEEAQRLYGTVIAIPTAWSDEYPEYHPLTCRSASWPTSPCSATA